MNLSSKIGAIKKTIAEIAGAVLVLLLLWLIIKALFLGG